MDVGEPLISPTQSGSHAAPAERHSSGTSASPPSGAPDGGLAAVPELCRSTGAACDPLWVGEINGSPTSTVVTAGGMVYVGSGDGSLYAFPMACDGACAPSAVVRVGSSTEGPAVWEGRALFVTAADGTLRALTIGGVDP